ncbi:MAG TPA: class I SAM-dependent methyltransferase [Verrucomicrobiae bacterium]|nr:class I SAM-dependent methyltransferase [Verrucomicrobiae bacterium]
MSDTVAEMSPTPQRRCDCQSGELVRLFAARDYISGDSFQIFECTTCGLAFTDPVPEQWERYYPNSYYGDPKANRFPRLIEWLQHQLYASRARKVEMVAGGKSGRVLDVGCGRGHLLRAFQRRGWDVTGTEMSDAAATYAREQLELPVHIGTLPGLKLPSASFDAAVMWHVLEHFERPTEALREIRRLLRPGGAFLVAVPNFGSPEARAARDKWFHLDVPRHLTHFTSAALIQSLESASFGIEAITDRSFEYDFFSAAQSFLNYAGLRMNWLYSALRDGRATGFGQWLGHLACGPAAGLFGLSAMLAGGSTMVVYARKT